VLALTIGLSTTQQFRVAKAKECVFRWDFRLLDLLDIAVPEIRSTFDRGAPKRRADRCTSVRCDPVDETAPPQEGIPMKYIITARIAPGVENSKAAFDMFGKVGAPDNMEALYAAADGKTFIGIVNGDPNITNSLTYAPFYDDVTVHAIVDLDDAWMAAATAAMANLER